MLQYLKLGGSLITEKELPYTPRAGILRQAATEVRAYLTSHPGEKLIIGHGSGSFGHTSAARYKTKMGVSGPTGWLGYAQVCRDARALNQLVLDALLAAGVPAVSFPPSATVRCAGGEITAWDTTAITQALANDLVPLIFGDTVLDDQLGGTICSTEDLFLHLSKSLPPARVLLAGIEPAVWADFPARQVKLAVIHASESLNANNKISGSIFTDVTGGMAAKVQKMAALVQQYPKCEVLLFSGIAPGAILAALSGNYPGTAILP